MMANCTLGCMQITEPDSHQQHAAQGQWPQVVAGEIPLNRIEEIFQNENRHAVKQVLGEICEIPILGDIQNVMTKP